MSERFDVHGVESAHHVNGPASLSRPGPGKGDVGSDASPTLQPSLAEAARVVREAMKNTSYRATRLGEHVGSFMRYTLSQNWEQRSRAEYESTLYRFALYFADLDLPDFTPPVGIERVEEFIEATWGAAARGTRAKNISILKSFFRWAYERNRISGDPMLTIKRPRRRQPDRRRQAHEPKAVDAIVRAQHHQRDRGALLLMARLGLRKNELRLLKIGDIDLRDGVVHLLQKGGDRVAHPIGPFPDVVGELDAHITLDGRRADEYLLYPRWERRIGSERVVYREDKHRPLSPRGMHEWFAKRLEEAGVEHFPMHELRHTAGTEFHRAGKDLKRTQMFMRHKSITTTADTYMHLDRDDLEEAMKLAYVRWQQLSEEDE